MTGMVMPRSAFGLPAIGLATPIGVGREEVARTLFEGSRAGLIPVDDFMPGRTVHVGAVTAALPPVPAELSGLDSRNNRLMLLALTQIADAVDDAIHRFGRDRVGVVMGTSTGGIADGEAAFMRRGCCGVPVAVRPRLRSGPFGGHESDRAESKLLPKLVRHPGGA